MLMMLKVNPWIRVLLIKLIVAQLINKLSAFRGMEICICHRVTCDRVRFGFKFKVRFRVGVGLGFTKEYTALSFEEGGIVFLRNAGIYLRVYTTSQPVRPICPTS
jgi:hypothetical protein